MRRDRNPREAPHYLVLGFHPRNRGAADFAMQSEFPVGRTMQIAKYAHVHPGTALAFRKLNWEYFRVHRGGRQGMSLQAPGPGGLGWTRGTQGNRV